MKVYFIVLHVILPLFFPFKLCMLVFLSLFVLVSIICCIIFFLSKSCFSPLILVEEWDKKTSRDLVPNLSSGL